MHIGDRDVAKAWEVGEGNSFNPDVEEMKTGEHSR